MKEDSKKQIPMQLDRLGVLLEKLENDIIGFEEHISLILGVNLAQEDISEEKTIQEIAPLANIIRDDCLRTERIIEYLDNLRKRLQI